MTGQGVTSLELQSAIQRVVEEARHLDLRRFEEIPASCLVVELVPTVSDLVSRGIDLLTSILDHYEEPDRDESSIAGGQEEANFYRGIESLVNSAAGAAKIADLAFMARWELEAKKGALEKIVASPDSWKIIAECGSGRRRLMKSGIALEMAISEHERLPSGLEPHYLTELKRSLETRRVYAIFRRQLERAGEPEPDNLRRCLRAAGTGIATLVGRDIYEDLRVSDRIQLRSVQGRILEWLSQDEEYESGLRIWQDVESCSSLLLQVNKRVELCEHDAKVAGTALAMLAEAPRSSRVPPETFLQHAASLFGRDATIDGLLERGDDTTPGAWNDALVRLVEVVGGGGSDSMPDDRMSAQPGDVRE